LGQQSQIALNTGDFDQALSDNPEAGSSRKRWASEQAQLALDDREQLEPRIVAPHPARPAQIAFAYETLQ